MFGQTPLSLIIGFRGTPSGKKKHSTLGLDPENKGQGAIIKSFTVLGGITTTTPYLPSRYPRPLNG